DAGSERICIAQSVFGCGDTAVPAEPGHTRDILRERVTKDGSDRPPDSVIILKLAFAPERGLTRRQDRVVKRVKNAPVGPFDGTEGQPSRCDTALNLQFQRLRQGSRAVCWQSKIEARIVNREAVVRRASRRVS